MSVIYPVGFLDDPWVGAKYKESGIFILGESWYGDWGTSLNSDSGYIEAYLRGTVKDAMYTRMANACQIPVKEFWDNVLFTNFVPWAGLKRIERPTTAHYLDAYVRLEKLLEKHCPKGVWVLGKGQAEFSGHLLERYKVPYEVVVHPTSYGVKNETLFKSWNNLLAKLHK